MKKILLIFTVLITISSLSLFSQTIPTYNNNNLVHEIHYSTYDQNMWGPGESFDINFEFELFDIQINEGFQEGFIQEIFPGASFGFMIDMGIWMYLNSTFSMTGFEGGSIDLEYPVEITLEFPDDYSFDQGQTITIHSSYEVLDGWLLEPTFPEHGVVALVLRYGFGMHFDAIICMFTCDTIPIIPSMSFPVVPYDTEPMPHDSIAIFYINGETGQVAYPCPDTGSGNPGICEDTILPIIIADWFNIGLEGEINIPHISEYETWLDDDTQCLHAYGQDDDPWLFFNLDILEFLSFIAGFIPPPNGPAIEQAIDFIQGGVIEYEIIDGVVATIDYFILQLNLSMSSYLTQDISFCPTIYATLHFPTEVEYTETDPAQGNEVIESGFNDTITFIVNNDLNIVYPCYNWDTMLVDPVVYDITSGFTNHTYDNIVFELHLDAIYFHIHIPIDFDDLEDILPWSTIPEFELPELIVEDADSDDDLLIVISSPEIVFEDIVSREKIIAEIKGADIEAKDIEFCFPPSCEPLISESFDLFDFDFTWFNQTWDIEGLVQGVRFNGTELIPNPPLGIEVEGRDVICFGDTTGVIKVTAISSSGPFTYEYSNGVTNTHMERVDSIFVPGGYYYVTLTDVYGCQQFGEVNIRDENPPLRASFYPTDVLCAGEPTGTVTSYITGGVPPYSFEWHPSGSTEENPDSLYAGWHYVTVTDDVGCEHFDSVFIDEPDQPLEMTSEIGTISCYGYTDGYIDINVTGGTPPYTYEWSNGQYTQDLINIPAGVYSVTVTDSHNCELENLFIVTEPMPLELSIHVQHILCHGDSTGVISVTTHGGTAPYSYEWSNGATTPNLEDIPAGIYSVTVTDANDCKVYDLVELEEPSLPLTSFIEATDVRCFAEGNGFADLTVIGGTPPYYYEWSNGEISEDIEDLEPNMYYVTITDDNGCQIIDSVQIYQPFAPMQGTIGGTHVTCYGGSDGSIYIGVQGGWQYEHPDYNYTFTWSDGSFDQNREDLEAGDYSVTATDSNGCQYIMDFKVEEPEKFYVQTIDNPTICYGMEVDIGTSIISGGNEPYTVEWDDGQIGETISVSPEETTSYTLTVYDNKDCPSEEKTIMVTVHEQLKLEIRPNEDIVCPGDSVLFNFLIEGGGIEGNYVNYLDTSYSIPVELPVYEETNFVFWVEDLCGFDTVYAEYNIENFPTPAIDVQTSESSGCAPLTVEFTENTELGEGEQRIYMWDFDDGEYDNLSFSKNPTREFTNPRAYYVNLTVVSENKCKSDTIIPIHVFPIPQAQFSMSASNIHLINAKVHFTNLSQGGFYFDWNFGDGSGSDVKNPIHVYSEPGEFIVSLKTESLYGCTDSITRTVTVNSELGVWAPTAFTPNHDGKNETFKVFVDGIDPTKYQLEIYSRWGEKVFDGNHYNEEWDGTHMGRTCDPGVYAWILTFTDNFGNQHQQSGFVTLLR